MRKKKTWKLFPAVEQFSRIREQWDALNQIKNNHLLLDSDFVEPLLTHFGSKDILLAISDVNGVPSMALLEKECFGFWSTFQPSQAPIGLLLLSDYASPAQQIEDLMGSLPGVVLGLSVLQQDPENSDFQTQSLNDCVEILDYIPTARLRVSGSFDDYWKQRGKNLTHNLSRQRRRLADNEMMLSLQIDRDPQKVSECLADYGQLEGRGWKGKLGTAIVPGNTQGRFYTDLFQRFLKKGEGVIYRLQCNGQTVASDLCLCRNGMMILLKIAYDENLKGFSPSLLMREEIVRNLFKDPQVDTVEFYGRLRDWHTKWTNEVRTMFHLNFFRSPMIRKGRRRLKLLNMWLKGERSLELQDSSGGSSD